MADKVRDEEKPHKFLFEQVEYRRLEGDHPTHIFAPPGVAIPFLPDTEIGLVELMKTVELFARDVVRLTEKLDQAILVASHFQIFGATAMIAMQEMSQSGGLARSKLHDLPEDLREALFEATAQVEQYEREKKKKGPPHGH